MQKSFLAMLALVTVFAGFAQADSVAPKVRTYYIAADEVDWDYAPGGVNKMMGMKFEGILESLYRARTASHRNGLSQGSLPRIHRRNLHQLKPRPAGVGAHRHSRAHLARRSRRHHYAWFSRTTPPTPTACILTACSTTRTPKARLYDDGTSGADKDDDAVPPGKYPYLHLESPGTCRPRAQRSQLDCVALSLPHQRVEGCGERD